MREPGGEGDAIRGDENAKPERTLRPLPKQTDDVIQRGDRGLPRDRSPETERKPHVRPVPPDTDDAAPPERRPIAPVKPAGVEKNVERPARPETERPEGVYRPAPVERSVERERTERPERVERQDRRESPGPPVRTYEPPPARSEPAPRNEPPPQRSEPPARSAPAPQKSEPSNKETVRPARPKEADPK